MEEQLSEECPVLDIPPQMAPEAAEPRLLSDGSATHSEEEVALLPRNTKVIVTGNNRTKQSLIGLNGVVTKAVGLGGWHWLVRKHVDSSQSVRDAPGRGLPPRPAMARQYDCIAVLRLRH